MERAWAKDLGGRIDDYRWEWMGRFPIIKAMYIPPQPTHHLPLMLHYQLTQPEKVLEMKKLMTITTDGTLSLTVTNQSGQSTLLSVRDLPPEVLPELIMLGLKNKIRDSYAGVTDAEEALDRAKGMIRQLREGVFSRSSRGDDLWLAALVNLTEGDPKKLAVQWRGLSDTDRKRAKGDAQLRAEYYRLKSLGGPVLKEGVIGGLFG